MLINIQLEYSMGCVSAPESSRRAEIATDIKRLRLQIDSKTTKIQQEALKQEKNLLFEFQKPRPNRARAPEHSIAEQITGMYNQIHTYSVVKSQLDKILVYVNHMEVPDKARSTLFPAFRVILYSESILKDPQISTLCRSISKKFPAQKYGLSEATDAEVDSEIMVHHKRNLLPSQSMTNNYVLQLCSQEGLSLEEINSVGHNFRFGG